MFPSFEFTGQLNSRLPSVLAGLSLTSIVFMILTYQVGLYFWKASVHSRDSFWIKGIIMLTWMIQASDVALTCHMTAAAHSKDSVLAVELVHEWMWELVAYIGTSAVTECLVHGYFISRIYLLATNAVHVRISIILCMILILEGSFGIISMLSLIASNHRGSRHLTIWAVPLWLGFSVFIDISIAGSLYYILKKSGSYLSMSLSLLIRRLIRFCIQTGLITSLATGVTVIIWLVAQLDSGHLLMSFPMGGIYAICFMANLIARESYFQHVQLNSNTDGLDMAVGTIVFATREDFEVSGSITLEVD